MGSTLSYVVSDPLGSNTIALSSTGQVSALQHYSPYGTVDYTWGSMPTSFNYTGGQLDSQTGLLYDHFRSYDPISGRFVRSDNTQNNAKGVDPYAYVGDDPETRNDPSGHRAVDAGQGPSLTKQGLDGLCHLSFRCTKDLGSFNYALLTQALRDGLAWVATAFEVLPAVVEALEGNPEGLKAEEQEFEQLSEEVPGEQVLTSDLACSFTSTTKVETIRGKQAIGNIRPGEKALAYNPQTHKMEWQPIVHVWIHQDNDLVDLTITASAQTIKEKQKTTPLSEVIHTNKKHPFFTAEKGFLPVGQIKIGMHVLRADGHFGVVTGWKLVLGVKTMYNLEVAQDHTFTVGNGEWVVHNCGGQFDNRILEALSSSDQGTRFEGDAGSLVDEYSEVVSFQRKEINPATGKIVGDVDVESPNLLIEATLQTGGKTDQISKLLTNELLNPNGKPVVLYAPRYTSTGLKAIINNLPPSLADKFYYARTPQDLIEYLDTIGK
ncbi:MAG TPA: RHS repeat-associated core domain-containing protein [Ktedonobacteraceae bacterium]|nr:RHS repeat-associated core domain-containing protein [Ktedonobacteraceae bacterium]